MKRYSKRRLLSWKKTRGELNVRAKLTNAMARAIRRAYQPRKKGSSYKAKSNTRYNSMPYLAEQYNVSVATVRRIIRKESYKDSKISHDTPKNV